jgi:hypothetical protein
MCLVFMCEDCFHLGTMYCNKANEFFIHLKNTTNCDVNTCYLWTSTFIKEECDYNKGTVVLFKHCFLNQQCYPITDNIDFSDLPR